eukprot:3197952-Alexandrium_andersonii.AAC.1
MPSGMPRQQEPDHEPAEAMHRAKEQGVKGVRHKHPFWGSPELVVEQWVAVAGQRFFAWPPEQHLGRKTVRLS